MLKVETLTRAEDGATIEHWTMDRPEAMNAFNRALLVALGTELDRIEAGTETRAIVLSGGVKAFSAGADLKERRTMPPEEVPAFVRLIGGTFERIAASGVPFVAAIEGVAFGGGLEIALACDIRVAGAAASLGLTETRLAIIPGAGGTQRLARLVGVGRAKELILTGRKLDASEAAGLGVVEFVVEAGGAVARALDCAWAIAGGGPVAISAAKAAIDGGFHREIGAALEWERECYARTLPTTDRVEALLAFSEKRRPRFTGR